MKAMERESSSVNARRRSDSLPISSRQRSGLYWAKVQRGWLGMARIVAGFASSHTPLMSLPGQDWAKRAGDDKPNREFIPPRAAPHVTYAQLFASPNPTTPDPH